jgi:Site-specific DNA methylase
LAPTLPAGGHADSHANAGVPPAIAYAIQERAVCENPLAGPDGAGFRADDCVYTLEARTVPQAICITGEVTHTLKAEGFDASEDGTGRGQPIVACGFQASQSGVRINDVAGTLDANYGARRHNGALVGMAVRRLMPIECERLQGFPDGWTLVPTGRNRGPQMAADGPRYKQIGNSMAVNVMRWIGRRIQAAEEAMRAAA